MIKILSIFLISLVLAWFSEQQTNQCRNVGQVYRMRNDPAFLLLCLMLSLFAGLRTEYNDSLLSSKVQNKLYNKAPFQGAFCFACII